MAAGKILVVDDDQNICELLRPVSYTHLINDIKGTIG